MLTILYIPELFGIDIEVYFILLALGIPAFFIWRWLLKKFIKRDRVRKIAVWIATIVSAPLIYLGFVLLFIFIISYYPTHSFDREKWLSDKEKRYEFSKNIIESGMLIGKSKAEVRQILGDGDNPGESNYWHYNLGFKPGLFNIDPSTLMIQFKDDTVVEVKQNK